MWGGRREIGENNLKKEKCYFKHKIAFSFLKLKNVSGDNFEK